MKPADNQIDDLLKQLLRDMLENYGVDVDEEYWDAPNPRYIKSISAALATAIGEAIGEDEPLPPTDIASTIVAYGNRVRTEIREALRGIGLEIPE